MVQALRKSAALWARTGHLVHGEGVCKGARPGSEGGGRPGRVPTDTGCWDTCSLSPRWPPQGLLGTWSEQRREALAPSKPCTSVLGASPERQGITSAHTAPQGAGWAHGGKSVIPPTNSVQHLLRAMLCHTEDREMG